MLGPAIDWVSAILRPCWQSARRNVDRLIFGTKELDPYTIGLRSILSLCVYVFVGFPLVIVFGTMDGQEFLFIPLYLLWSLGALLLMSVTRARERKAKETLDKLGIRKYPWIEK